MKKVNERDVYKIMRLILFHVFDFNTHECVLGLSVYFFGKVTSFASDYNYGMPLKNAAFCDYIITFWIYLGMTNRGILWGC